MGCGWGLLKVGLSQMMSQISREVSDETQITDFIYSGDEQLAILLDAFRWLEEQLGAGKFDFSRVEIRSFVSSGAPVPVVDAQRGVWNPKELSSTLSVVSMLQSKYADETDDDVSIIRHHYRDTHVNGATTKLRLAINRNEPITHFK